MKRCLESLRKNIPDKKIIVIDGNNFGEYVNMPDYITDKWHRGIIGNAHFSDLLRLEPADRKRRLLDRCYGIVYGFENAGIHT